jgi:ribonucleoside-diphosphate reductase alpha chain
LAQEIMPYVSFLDSPMAYGKFQFDLWEDKITHSGMWDWEKLRQDVMDYGIRNSLLVAPMPTASTSQLLGNNEAFEPFTSNIYVRRTIAGEFILVNKYLQKDLLELGIWNDEIKNSIIANKGSVQQLDIPDELKELYKTVWEIPMKVLIDQAADRGHYICQSQSMNLWMESPNYKKLTSMHFYAWGKGLKTGIYYLRTKAKAAPQQFTIEPTKKSADDNDNNNDDDDDPICDMCSA